MERKSREVKSLTIWGSNRILNNGIRVGPTEKRFEPRIEGTKRIKYEYQEHSRRKNSLSKGAWLPGNLEDL